MQAASFIGGTGFYLSLLVVAFWCVSPRPAATVGVALALSGTVNAVLKLVFAQPRPYWNDPQGMAHAAEPTFGMPSGHAQAAVVVWGLLAVHVTRRGRPVGLPGPLPALRPGWVWAPAGAVIVLVGVSRVYLGVHSAGQVAAGWAVGAVLLAGVVRFGPRLLARWRALRIGWQVTLSAAVTLGAVAGALAALAPPGEWGRLLVDGAAGAGPERAGLEDALQAAGLLGGLAAGLSVTARRGWFTAGGPPPRRAARLPVGLAGLAVINLTVGFGPAPPALLCGRLLSGLWIGAGAVEVFVRAGLARRSTPALPRTGEPAMAEDT